MRLLSISTPRAIKFLLIFPVLTIVFNYVFGELQWNLPILVGAALMLVNIVLLTWAWRRIFIKKSIALAVSVIVIKYAIIGLLVFKLAQKETFEMAGFLIGLTSVLPSMLLAAVMDHKNKD